MAERVAEVTTLLFETERDEPYLGPLGPKDFVTSRGYIVRGHSGTIYPAVDRSVVVRVVTDGGIVGWGETYGLVAPRVIAELIHDIAFDFIRGEDTRDPAALHDRLYGLMRVRGYTGGFWLDALSAIDIALWDIAAKAKGLNLAKLLNNGPTGAIHGYVSGLPGATLDERVVGAAGWAERGFDKFKFALAVADDAAAEFAGLREALGEDAEISIDMHWLATAEAALADCRRIVPYRPWFVEAPCMPEDIEGLANVCAGSDLPIAVGEEWRTVHDARLRMETGIAIVQPEMGHAGITEFLRIAGLAARLGKQVIPHSTVGMGIFLSASLQASLAAGVRCHEFQHSVLCSNERFLVGSPKCEAGLFVAPTGPGHGVEPSAEGILRLTELAMSR